MRVQDHIKPAEWALTRLPLSGQSKGSSNQTKHQTHSTDITQDAGCRAEDPRHNLH